MLDKDLLQDMIAQQYVSKRKHPNADLYIYNYTAKAQYDWVWNDVTRKCRGLIMDSSDNVIARPFEKFFNLDDTTELPLEPFVVTEKMDGSLGVLYWIGDKPYIATRGSFESDQAVKATELLHSKYAHVIDRLDRELTYLFEIIFPANRIVVDYGSREDLILLATIHTASGQELTITDVGFPCVQEYTDVDDVRKLAERQEDNAEGFVISFQNGLRIKVKFEEYKRLHRLVTQVSNVVIWEYLRDGKPFAELIDRVPDEFYAWLSKTKLDIETNYQMIEAESRAAFRNDFDTRKDAAMYFKTQKYPHVLFAMLDGKDYAPMIWKEVRPKWSQPFKTDEF